MTLEITTMDAGHWPAVREIYIEGIETGLATFETEPPSWHVWDGSHLPCCRIVAIRAGTVIAWAALSPVSSRCVYAGVAEVSVYVAAAARGQGIGTIVLKVLVEESEKADIWTLQAGIFPDNRASIRLHQRCGFRVVGRRQRLGKWQGEWRDVLLLERRSRRVGL